MTSFVTVSLSWVDWAFPTKDKKLITITKRKTFIVIYFKSPLNKVNVRPNWKNVILHSRSKIVEDY